MSLRDLERESIRSFVQDCADKGFLSGRVLDYGCGKTPYLSIVAAAGGDYWGWDNPNFGGYVENLGSVYHMGDEPPEGPFDAILCTQVIQYVHPWEIWRFVDGLLRLLRPEGRLVMTGPTNWPTVEDSDMLRYTTSAVEALLEPGFSEHEIGYRAHVEFEGERWPLGWWAVARA